MAEITVAAFSNSNPGITTQNQFTADNGNIWFQTQTLDTGEIRYYYSTNKGASWSEDTGGAFGIAYPIPGGFTAVGDKVFATMADLWNGQFSMIFRWGVFNAARTSITWTSWTYLWGPTSDNYIYPGGLVAHAEGSGYKVHASSTNRFWSDLRYWRMTMNSSGNWTSTDTSATWSSGGGEAIGETEIFLDPVTKDIHLVGVTGSGGSTRDIHYMKRAYTSATWPAGTDRTIHNGNEYLAMTAMFDGDRTVIATTDSAVSTSTPLVFERDKADTTTTTRTPPSGVANSGNLGTEYAITYNASKDIFLVYNDQAVDDSDVYKNVYTRGSNTWSGASLVRDVVGTSFGSPRFHRGTKYLIFVNSDYDYIFLDDLMETAYTGSATLIGVATTEGSATFDISGGSVIPRPLVEIAFTTDPTSETPIWTDVTEYVERISIRRGRQRELDVIEPGTATLVLENDDRRFDPLNTASPYYPNILPVRRIRIRAIWDNVIYNVFSGYAHGWPQEYPDKRQNMVSLDAIDALGFLSFAELTVTRGQELSGARIAGILNDANWPASDRLLDEGEETLAPVTERTGTGLALLQDVSATEMGRLFAGQDGKIHFHSREDTITAPAPSVGTWNDADDGAGNAYDDVVPEQDEGEIYNRVTVTRTDGEPQEAEDATSQAAYFLRDLSQSDLPLLTDGDALARAQFLLARYKDPKLRITSMEVDPRTDGAYAAALGLELGDTITVQRFVDDPPTISQDVFVDGISIDVDRDNKVWDFQFALTEIPETGDFWVAGESLLGVDTELGF